MEKEFLWFKGWLWRCYLKIRNTLSVTLRNKSTISSVCPYFYRGQVQCYHWLTNHSISTQAAVRFSHLSHYLNHCAAAPRLAVRQGMYTRWATIIYSWSFQDGYQVGWCSGTVLPGAHGCYVLRLGRAGEEMHNWRDPWGYPRHWWDSRHHEYNVVWFWGIYIPCYSHFTRTLTQLTC